MSKPSPQVGILFMALPTIVGNLLYSTVGFASIKIVGSLGTAAIAAVLGGERALLFTQVVFLLVTAGTTALVAQSWGAKDKEAATHYVKVSLLMMLAVSALLTLVTCLFAAEIAALLGLQGEAAAYAAKFLFVSALFNIPAGVALVMASSLRAAGDPYTPLWTFGVANVLNVALCYVFVYGAFGIPPLGVAGAALGNGLSFGCAGLALLGLWRARRLSLETRTSRATLDRASFGKVARIGAPAAVEQLLFHSGLVAMMFIVSRFGENAFAAYGVGLNLMSFSYVFGFGFAIASATVVGQRIGAGDQPGARAAAWRSAMYCAACMTTLGVAILLLGGTIQRFLGLGAEVGADLRSMLIILALVQPLMALEFALGGALRGAGDTRTAMFITLGGLFVRLSVALAAYSAGLDVAWVFAALLLDYGLKASLYTARLGSPRWHTRLAKV